MCCVCLLTCSIGYILNVTREIDNFYPGMFKYKNIRWAMCMYYEYSVFYVCMYVNACTES